MSKNDKFIEQMYSSTDVKEDERYIESWESYLHCKEHEFVADYINTVIKSDGKTSKEFAKIAEISGKMNECLPDDQKNNILEVSQYIEDLIKVPGFLGGNGSSNIKKMTIPNFLRENDGKKKLSIEDFLEKIKFNRWEAVCFIYWLFYSLLLIPNDYKEIKVSKDLVKGKSDNLSNVMTCSKMLGMGDTDIRDVIRIVLKNADRGIAIEFESKHPYFEKPLRAIGDIPENNNAENDTNEVQSENAYVDAFKRYLEIPKGLSCILVNTVDELEAKEIIEKAAAACDNGHKVYCWDLLHGLTNVLSNERCFDKASLDYVIDYLSAHLNDWTENRIYILRNIENEMSKPGISGKIKILLEEVERHNCQQKGKITIFMLARHLSLDSSVEKNVYIDESIGYPNEDVIRRICTPYIDDYESENNIKINRKSVISNCKGLTSSEIERVIQLSIRKGDIEKSVLCEKNRIIKNSALLEVIDTSGVMEPCGLENIKKTIADTKRFFSDKEKATAYKVDPPRGILITGIPGCGKSMSAKYAGKELGRPLLKLDMGNLMSKYQGESDHNFRDALKIAESSEPCVLWIDEIEKAFNANTEQSESSSRILGYFLSWLQEKTSDTFVIGTSNDISKLPPELTRLGRFDALYYVGLPNEKEIKEIFDKHIQARDMKFKDTQELVKVFKGYSGAEIEQIVKEVNKKRIFSEDPQRIDIAYFKAMKTSVTPLSETCKEEIEALKKTYEKRHFVNASDND